MARTITFRLDDLDDQVFTEEITRKQVLSRSVDPTGPTILPPGESDLLGAIVAECLRDLREYRDICRANRDEHM